MRLDEKERYIIEKRYYDDYTQNDIAKELHISQAQVSRVEKQALENMRKYMY
jgi:RNA polymerase sporulation-specific sigma factor